MAARSRGAAGDGLLAKSKRSSSGEVPEGEKTNAMRILDAQRVPYRAFYYSSDILSAEGVARAMGVEPSSVYKTLVVLRERGRPMLVMVPGGFQLNLKLMARAVGEKSVRMATQKEAEQLTGLSVGGISALALLNRGFDVFIDQSALSLDEVIISAGRRGIDLRLKVSDLIRVARAKPVMVAEVAP